MPLSWRNCLTHICVWWRAGWGVSQQHVHRARSQATRVWKGAAGSCRAADTHYVIQHRLFAQQVTALPEVVSLIYVLDINRVFICGTVIPVKLYTKKCFRWHPHKAKNETAFESYKWVTTPAPSVETILSDSNFLTITELCVVFGRHNQMPCLDATPYWVLAGGLPLMQMQRLNRT